MATDREIFAEAARLSEAGTPFVLVTVIQTKGSSPRDPGAKMIWRPDAGLTGTVGGGQFEMLVTESAQRVFDARTCAQERFVLGADAEQCCGGVMEVFLEYCGQRQRLVVFGAGHVSEALADVLRGSPLELVIVDDRPEWNSPQRFGSARRVLNWEDGVRLARQRPADTLACVMTCSHDTDLDLLRDLLAHAEPPGLAPSGSGTPAFVGLIGSRSKRACLFGRLIAMGVAEDRVKGIHCPIGVGDTGKEPRMVAVSIAAQVLIEARRLGSSTPRAPTIDTKAAT